MNMKSLTFAPSISTIRDLGPTSFSTREKKSGYVTSRNRRWRIFFPAKLGLKSEDGSARPVPEAGSVVEASSVAEAGNAQSTPTRDDYVCSYCKNAKMVECPVCNGVGFHGRTITCRYCRGACQIECPLCVDDVYKFSFGARKANTESEEENKGP